MTREQSEVTDVAVHLLWRDKQPIGFFIHLGQVVMQLPERWTAVYFTPAMAREAAKALNQLADKIETKKASSNE